MPDVNCGLGFRDRLLKGVDPKDLEKRLEKFGFPKAIEYTVHQNGAIIACEGYFSSQKNLNEKVPNWNALGLYIDPNKKVRGNGGLPCCIGCPYNPASSK